MFTALFKTIPLYNRLAQSELCVFVFLFTCLNKTMAQAAAEIYIFVFLFICFGQTRQRQQVMAIAKTRW